MQPPRTSVPNWVNSLAARGLTAFSALDVQTAVGGTTNARKLSLHRLVRRRILFQPHQGYFVVVPPEYRNVGSPPPIWYIDGLMRFLQLPYYVGVLSAAALYGAADQQPQIFQVCTSKPVRRLRRGPVHIMWLVKQNVATTPVQEQRTPNGYVQVSSPAATALDLVQFAQHAGGLNNVATILKDLVTSISEQDMVSALNHSHATLPTLQRLGYILSRISQSSVIGVIEQWLSTRKPRPVWLGKGAPVLGAPQDDRWHIIVNHVVDPDTDDDGVELSDSVALSDGLSPAVPKQR